MKGTQKYQHMAVFGPGGLAIVITIVQSFGPGGLRAPCMLACAMRSLAIVITIVQSFSPSFAFEPLRGNSHVRNNFCPNILV